MMGLLRSLSLCVPCVLETEETVLECFCSFITMISYLTNVFFLLRQTADLSSTRRYRTVLVSYVPAKIDLQVCKDLIIIKECESNVENRFIQYLPHMISVLCIREFRQPALSNAQLCYKVGHLRCIGNENMNTKFGTTVV